MANDAVTSRARVKRGELGVEPILTLNATPRATIARLGAEKAVLFLELLRSLDLSSRINRFGHPASDASVETYVTA